MGDLRDEKLECVSRSNLAGSGEIGDGDFLSIFDFASRLLVYGFGSLTSLFLTLIANSEAA